MLQHHNVKVRRPEYAVALHAIVMGTAQSGHKTQSFKANIIPFLCVVVVVVVVLPIPTPARAARRVVVDVCPGGRSAVGGGWEGDEKKKTKTPHHMAPAFPPAMTALLDPKHAFRIMTSNPKRRHRRTAKFVFPPDTSITSASSTMDAMIDVGGAFGDFLLSIL